MAWDPEQYLQFKRDRMRPALELINRIPMTNPKSIVDLGCGPATSTRLLGEHFADAKLIGIDNSAEMINQARQEYANAEYQLADAGLWVADEPVDLVYSNALLHWLPDHEALLSRLSDSIGEAGALAIQMPDNMQEPSHQIMLQVANSDTFSSKLQAQSSARHELASVSEYYDWLQRHFTRIDIWQTCYSHVLPGAEQIVEWMKGAALTPYLSVLDEQEQGGVSGSISQRHLAHLSGSG